MLRSLREPPTLSAAWNEDYEQKAAEWFELFLDLMMVAVCSDIARKLNENLDGGGLAHFVALFCLYFSSWQLYTHYNSRFNENSLLHYVLLFGLLCGFGGMVLSSEPGTIFATGLLITRLAIAGMNINTFLLVPAARDYLTTELSMIAVDVVALALCLLLPGTTLIPAYVVLLAVAFVVRPIVTLTRSQTTDSVLRIAINIDHYSDRNGCMVLVVLGEAVLKSILNLEQSGKGATTQFYSTMVLSLMVIFALAIFYFGAQPPRSLHAMRRAVWAGLLFTYVHYVLLAALLSFGVGVTVLANNVKKDVPAHNGTDVWLIFGSISTSMAAILCLRVLHFGGRSIKVTDPKIVKQLKMLWWAFTFSSPVLPLLCGGVMLVMFPKRVDSLVLLAIAFGSLSLQLFGEATVVHYLSIHGQRHVCSGTDECVPETPHEQSFLASDSAG
ncbi:hypothetical protein H310_00115 [Aphanomyces invadans]|uniref:Low temperature requirement protein LtrA n=1 Tax=Aphanomyces invadans TaxID=157072 RepID=A0A024UT94_9STRA|nr:hypothetical protein H310_00115 [Aphanomyces invadans]ETW09564.1 hypothetical protein H310_00115 [Aphanomyces invadans]|eukprot:XP_008860975.1 hypothetical protein H310_00115 [Aphanomyces invadans]